MNKKMINPTISSAKRLIYFLFFALFYFVFTQISFAGGFARHEIIFEKYGDIYYSPIIYENESFNSVIITSRINAEGLMVNFNPLNGGLWENFELHDDGFGHQAILFTSPTRSAQFKKTGGGDITLNADILYSVSHDGGVENLYAGPQVASSGFKIISRKEWGADESMRYWSPELEDQLVSDGKDNDTIDVCGDFAVKYKNEIELERVIKTGANGQHLIWPLSYAKQVRKFVIHHTDSELRDMTGDKRTDSMDYKIMVRAIYHFHAVTRGWGDIGYNYLIDPMGNVYEGRYGGDRVIGAHTRCYNNGSIGIAIIGNYDSNNPSEPALNSLISLIAQKAKTLKIEPRGESVFRGKSMPNILGHKDLGATSCPGSKLYSLIPKIRERADFIFRSGSFSETSLSSQNYDYNAELISDNPTISMLPNERKKMTLRFKNTGSKTWDNSTWLHVSLNNRNNARVVPIVQDKVFVAADMREKSVAPGQTASFDVEFESGYYAGNYDFQVSPVVNGRYKVSRASVFISIQIKEPRFDYKIISEDLPSGTVFQGQKIQAYIKAQNTGNVKWVNYGNNPIRMGTEDLRDRRSLLVKTHTTRIAHLIESEVLPGGTGTFFFDLHVPERYEGKINERFSPVIENIKWLENKGLGFTITVKKPKHGARITNRSSIPSMLPGEMAKIELTMENTGDLPWDPNNMRVTLLNQGITTFKRSIVPEKTVNPKQKVDLSFWVQAPYTAGRYQVFLRPRFNLTPIQGGAARFTIDVPEPKLRAQINYQTPRAVNIKAGQEKELVVKFKNISNAVWQNKGSNTIYLAPARPQDRLSEFYYEDNWVNKYRATTMDEKEVSPGEIATFRFKVKSDKKGNYSEYFQLVIENVGWINSSFVRWNFNVNDAKASSSADANKDAANNSGSATTITPVKEVIPKTSPQTFSDPKSEQQFRVRISYGDDNSKITANKNYKVYGKNNEILFSVGAETWVNITRANSVMKVQLGSASKTSEIVKIIPDAGGIVEIKTMERRPAWNNNFNDNRFRGVMEVRAVNGETAYINELPFEDYMKGLAEVSNDTPAEKQKAIAVLARSYARFYMSDKNRKFPGLPYDGNDDPAVFQKYLGYGVEIRSPNFVKAVQDTQDVVVTYNGNLIKTPYFSQSDGRTLSAQEVWGWKDTPYLQSVDDPYCAGLTRQGHGVGMSGCGSDGMAKAGKAYEEIIKYYYQGVKIEKLDF